MTNRELIRMKAEGIEVKKIEKACSDVFEYLDREGFSLLEIKYLISSMGLILADVVQNDPLRKIEEFNYSSSVACLFSSKAASNTTS